MERPRHTVSRLLCDSAGSALLELAISLPLLVVFIVGIYDFSGAFNQKQKLESAAQVGAIVAGAQPTSDIETTNADPLSLRPIVTAIFNSLAGSGVIPNANQGTCKASSAVVSKTGGLQWTYAIPGCPDTISIIINRGWVPNIAGVPPITDASTLTVGTLITLQYPYHWRFNSAIQLLLPGATYSATTYLSETAKVHNQL
jgi:hypothetical protein